MADFRTANPKIINLIVAGAKKKGRIEGQEVLTTFAGAEIGSYLISSEDETNAIMVFKDTTGGSCIRSESGEKLTVIAQKEEFKTTTQGIAEIMQGKKPTAAEAPTYSDSGIVVETLSLETPVTGEVTQNSFLRDNNYLKAFKFIPDSYAHYDIAVTLSGNIRLDYISGSSALPLDEAASIRKLESDVFREFCEPNQIKFLKFISTTDFGTGSFSIEITKYLQFALKGSVKKAGTNGNENIPGAVATLTNIIPGTLPQKTADASGGAYNFTFEAGSDDESWQLSISAPGYQTFTADPVVRSSIVLSLGTTINAEMTALQINTTNVAVAEQADAGSEYEGSVGSDNDLYIGYDGSRNNSYLLFRNVNIPQGANITETDMTVKSGSSPGTVISRILAGDIANPDRITTFEQWSAMPRTTAYVDWTMVQNLTGVFYTSPNFSAVIQEIVSRPDWVSGNNIMILLDDVSDTGSTDNYGAFKNSSATFLTTMRIRWTE